jgi:hypothetical protein
VDRNEQAYVRLQKHLDRQPIGFPATRSGAELKILKHIFTPQEAEIACCLNYKFEPLKTIYKWTRQLVYSPAELENVSRAFSKRAALKPKATTAKWFTAQLPWWWGCTNINSTA